MNSLLYYRLPLSSAVAAVLTATGVATTPVFHAFPLERPLGWASLPLCFFVLTYTGVTVCAGLEACVVTLLGRPRRAVDGDPAELLGESRLAALDGAASGNGSFYRVPSLTGQVRCHSGRVGGSAGETTQCESRFGLRRHLLAGALLALLVVTEGEAHAGDRSGAWATSRPRQERSSDAPPADGHAFWIDGIPVHAESSYVMDQVDAMSRRSPDAPMELQQGISRTGHAAYAFLLTLLIRPTALLGSIYAGVLAVNLLLWWAGAMAIYDLARRCRGSWWVGLLAGSLVATGLGFTFNAGNAMSAAAAYGAVPVVLWVMERLGGLTRNATRYDDLLTACIGASASLLYGLTPLYLTYAFFRYVGRVEMRRLLMWALALVGLVAAWPRVLHWAGGPPSNSYFEDSVPFAIAVAGCFVAAAFLAGAPRRWSERVVAGTVCAAAATLLAALFVAPMGLVGVANAATVGLQIPHYMGGLGDVTVRWADQSSADWISVLDGQRTGLLDGNFLAAFPAPICVFALAGFFRLPRRWCEWCVALIASAALVTVVMNIATGDHHPRLAYMGYPAVYLLAASGLANLYHTTRWFFMRYVRLAGPSAQVFAAAVVVLCLIPAVTPSHAALWGDWSFDAQFHYLTQE